MDVREELRSLTTDVRVPPRADGIEVFHRGRRRRIRRRAAAGLTGVALVAALVAVALPGVPPAVVTIEDRIADQPPEEVPAPTPDVPETPDGSTGTGEGTTTPEDPTVPERTPPEGATPSDEDPSSTASPPVSTVPPLPGEATTADHQQEPGGAAALTLTDVRVGSHDGFDRVVMELEGDGQVGWFTTVGDRAVQDGSGEEFDMAGDGVLTVALRGILLPPDRPAGVEGYPSGRVGPPAGASALTEVVVGHVFEGQHEVFIGTNQPVTYRIARLEAPQRVVIDLVHP